MSKLFTQDIWNERYGEESKKQKEQRGGGGGYVKKAIAALLIPASIWVYGISKAQKAADYLGRRELLYKNIGYISRIISEDYSPFEAITKHELIPSLFGDRTLNCAVVTNIQGNFNPSFEKPLEEKYRAALSKAIVRSIMKKTLTAQKCRYNLMRSLGYVPHKNGVGLLLIDLQRKDPTDSTLYAIKELKERRTVPRFIRMLYQSTYYEDAAVALKTLADIGDESSVPEIFNAIRSRPNIFGFEHNAKQFLRFRNVGPALNYARNQINEKNVFDQKNTFWAHMLIHSKKDIYQNYVSDAILNNLRYKLNRYGEERLKWYIIELIKNANKRVRDRIAWRVYRTDESKNLSPIWILMTMAEMYNDPLYFKLSKEYINRR